MPFNIFITNQNTINRIKINFSNEDSDDSNPLLQKLKLKLVQQNLKILQGSNLEQI